MPANLENSAMATGLEKISFHSNPKERQCQRMFKPTTQLHSSHMLARASLIAQLVKNPQCRRPQLIPGSGRSPGEGIGYPLQYSWVSLVARLVKNPLAMQDTWVWSLGWKIPGEGNGYPLQYSDLENSLDCVVHGVAKSRTQLNNSLSLSPYTRQYM